MRYEDLDPGIVETVRWLNDLGYSTTDSGDGVTKFEKGRGFEGVLTWPHVVITLLNADCLVEECRKLSRLISKTLGYEPRNPPDDGSDWFLIEGSYNTVDNIPLIMVMGLHDKMLPKDLA